VILRWRHAPLHSLFVPCDAVVEFAGGACGLELSRQTTLNSLRRRASNSVLSAATAVSSGVNGGCCAFFWLSGDACITRNSMAKASRSLCRQRWYCHGNGPGMRRYSGGHVRAPGVLPRGAVLRGAPWAMRSRPAGFTSISARCLGDGMRAPADWAGKTGRDHQALLAPAWVLEHAAATLTGLGGSER